MAQDKQFGDGDNLRSNFSQFQGGYQPTTFSSQPAPYTPSLESIEKFFITDKRERIDFKITQAGGYFTISCDTPEKFSKLNAALCRVQPTVSSARESKTNTSMRLTNSFLVDVQKMCDDSIKEQPPSPRKK